MWRRRRSNRKKTSSLNPSVPPLHLRHTSPTSEVAGSEGDLLREDGRTDGNGRAHMVVQALGYSISQRSKCFATLQCVHSRNQMVIPASSRFAFTANVTVSTPWTVHSTVGRRLYPHHPQWTHQTIPFTFPVTFKANVTVTKPFRWRFSTPSASDAHNVCL